MGAQKSVMARIGAALAMAVFATGVLFLASPPVAAAPWTLQSLAQGLTPTSIAQLLAGQGTTVSGVTFAGNSASAGTFTDPSAATGLVSGVVLSSGEIAAAAGPNNSPGAGEDLGGAGDAALDAIVAPFLTQDATVLSFTIVPTSSQLNISYVFASEEYTEFVGSEFNDVFAFFVNGVNCAVVPGTNDRVTVNSIHSAVPGVAAMNAGFYIDNPDTARDTQFDGFTIPLTCRATVTAGSPATIRLAIADTSDGILDSAVFLQAGGITSSPVGACKAVTPVRAIDTRATARVTPTAPLVLTLAGSFNVPAGAIAVTLNVTATDASATGYLTVYPTGDAPPPSSNVNYVANVASPNSVIVKLGTGGRITIATVVPVNVIVDVFGWCGPGGTDRLLPIAPGRVLDTRPTGKVGPAAPLIVQIAGHPGVPATGATAAVLNVTAVNAEAQGYLTVYPADQVRPDTSSVNYASASPVANLVIAPLSADGKVAIFSERRTDVIIDVTGWWGPGGVQEFSLITPARLHDSRQESYNPTRVKLGTTPIEIQVAGNSNVPPIARGVVLNVTVDQPDGAGYLTVWPADRALPDTSNLNFNANQTIPNSVLIGLSPNGKIRLSSSVPTHVIVDITGWFA